MIEIKDGAFKVIPNGIQTNLTLKEALDLLGSYYATEELGRLR